jgi:hypothetical protein
VQPGRAVTGQRRKEGVTPIQPPAPLPLPPAPGSEGHRAGTRSSGRGAARRLRAGQGGSLGLGGWVLPLALALRLPASPGAAADILRRAGEGSGIATAAGKWRWGGSARAGGSGRALPRPSLAFRPAIPQGRSEPRVPSLPIPALGRAPSVSVCFSNSPCLFSCSSFSGSCLTSSPCRGWAACLFPLKRRKFSLFVSFFFFPSPLSPGEMQCGRLRHRNIRGESFNSHKSETDQIKTAFCRLSRSSSQLPNTS